MNKRFNYIVLLIIPVFMSFNVKKVNNNDLRRGTVLFTCESLEKENSQLYEVQQRNSSEYTLDLIVAKDLKKRTKLSNIEATGLDDYFVSEFIDMKYMLAPQEKEKCKILYVLSIRGETFDVCQNDQARVDRVKKIFEKLSTISNR